MERESQTCEVRAYFLSALGGGRTNICTLIDATNCCIFVKISDNFMVFLCGFKQILNTLFKNQCPNRPNHYNIERSPVRFYSQI